MDVKGLDPEAGLLWKKWTKGLLSLRMRRSQNYTIKHMATRKKLPRIESWLKKCSQPVLSMMRRINGSLHHLGFGTR